MTDLVDALSANSLKPDTSVHLSWPNSKCQILRDDIVLIDTPGWLKLIIL